jgi:RES domain-containing protein
VSEFAPDPKIAAGLASLETQGGPDAAWKHTLPGQSPIAANEKGARWNPPGSPAIYLALDQATARAEGNHLVSKQPQPIRGLRLIHRMSVEGLAKVLDLRDSRTLSALGVSAADLVSDDHTACRKVGGTAEWFGYDAMIVPSARSDGANLVVFPRRTSPEFDLQSVDSAPVD